MINILFFVAGIVLGFLIKGRKDSGGLIGGQTARKTENKEKILRFLREKGRVTNNDVEKLVGVSNATAERYLDELEKEGKLIQRGEIGRNVFYTLK